MSISPVTAAIFCGAVERKTETCEMITGPITARIIEKPSTTTSTAMMVASCGRSFLLSILSINLASGFRAIAKKAEIKMMIKPLAALRIK